MSPAKTDEPIEMPFEMCIPVSSVDRVLGAARISQSMAAILGHLVAHCKEWGTCAYSLQNE